MARSFAALGSRGLLALLLLLGGGGSLGGSGPALSHGLNAKPAQLGHHGDGAGGAAGAAKERQRRGSYLSMSVQTPTALPGAGLGSAMPAFPVRLVLRDDPRSVVLVDKAEYRELHAVAKLLVQSFYEKAGLPRVLSELSRLQSNFHYDDARHLMLTARDENTGDIVAYCDVDARPAPGGGTANTAPRPYLSDLGVGKAWRRRGVATALVRVSEEVCRGWGFDRMHLKVDQHNTVARNMYAKLGYGVASPDGVTLDVPPEGIPAEELTNPMLQFASARLLCCKELELVV